MKGAGISHVPALPPIEQDVAPMRPRRRRGPVDPDRQPFRSSFIIDVGTRRHLDEMSVALRTPAGGKFSDSAILRAALRALHDAAIDFREIRTEEELHRFLKKRLTR